VADLFAQADTYVSLYDLFVTHTWWRYRSTDSFSVYHYLNLVEGTIWLVFAALVATRFLRWRHSWVEVLYAAAFLTFGLSDFREAYQLESWLLLFKGANLVLLLWLRHEVIRRWYPNSRVY
jgi:hypothetical protein